MYVCMHIGATSVPGARRELSVFAGPCAQQSGVLCACVTLRVWSVVASRVALDLLGVNGFFIKRALLNRPGRRPLSEQVPVEHARVDEAACRMGAAGAIAIVLISSCRGHDE